MLEQMPIVLAICFELLISPFLDEFLYSFSGSKLAI
jgi:hypothetical protein